jgi:hypothetical protein
MLNSKLANTGTVLGVTVYKKRDGELNEGWMFTAIYIWFKDCLHTSLERCSHTKF